MSGTRPIVVSNAFEARFWDKIDKSAGLHGCWLWTAAPRGNGYGAIKLNGKVVSSHRVAYTLANGPIGDDQVVMHRCDVRLCCNPSHLSLGTLSENIADMDSKGRRVSRERLSVMAKDRRDRPPLNNKLSLAQVEEIRAAIASGQKPGSVATRYGVHRTTAMRIANGARWAAKVVA